MDDALAFLYIAQYVRSDGPTRAGVLLADLPYSDAYYVKAYRDHRNLL